MIKHLSSICNANYIYIYAILVILEWTTEDILAKHTSTVSHSEGFNGKIDYLFVKKKCFFLKMSNLLIVAII